MCVPPTLKKFFLLVSCDSFFSHLTHSFVYMSTFQPFKFTSSNKKKKKNSSKSVSGQGPVWLQSQSPGASSFL